MEVRPTLLPNDLQYCLDGASECCGITAAADIAIRLYGDAARLDKIWNENRGEKCGRRTWRNDLQNREIEVERYAAEIIAQLPGPRRTALVERGLLSLCHDVKDKADWLSDSHYVDSTKGGHLRPHLARWRVNRDMIPTPKVARRLRSRAAIKRYIVAEGDALPKQRQLFEILASIPPGGPATDADRDAIFRDLDGQMDSHRREQRAAIERARFFEEMNDRGEPVAQVDGITVRLKPGVREKMRRERKEARRAVKRAAMLAAAMLGVSTVSAFARGERVLLGGTQVSIFASLTDRISAVGHGALRIAVHDIDGSKLAGVCVYQDAPALDQLVSLAMHVQAGCIEDVLSTGNLYAIEPSADSHPVIAAHRNSRPGLLGLQELGEVMDGAHLRPAHHFRRDEREMFEAGKAAYVIETRDVYEDIIATIVFGPASKIWRKHRDALVGDSE